MLYLNDKDRRFLSIITFHRANDGLSAYHDPVNERVLFLLPLTDFCLCFQYAFPCILFSLLSIAYAKLIFCCLRRIIGETFKIMCYCIRIQSSLYVLCVNSCQFLKIKQVHCWWVKCQPRNTLVKKKIGIYSTSTNINQDIWLRKQLLFNQLKY